MNQIVDTLNLFYLVFKSSPIGFNDLSQL